LIRTPPAKVARALRQEAGFGCAVCGCPIIEYHHIIEWHERQHFDVDHMVALCPTHHQEYGKLTKDHAYKAKSNPINIRNGILKGYLGGNKDQKSVKIGGSIISNTDNILEYAGNTIFSYAVSNGQILLDALLPDKFFWPEIKIRENSIVARTVDFWDIQFKTNWVKFNRAEGDICLEIDFRSDIVKIKGNLLICGEPIYFSPSKIKYNGLIIEGGRFMGGKTAFRFGPNGRVVPPNFAMNNPRAQYVEDGTLRDLK
jgi:hypothetical protein